MRAESHVVIGLGGVLFLQQVTHFIPARPEALMLALGMSVIGSAVADIDSDESALRVATRTNLGAGLLGWLASLGVRASFGGHRALTHTLLAAGALCVLVLLTGGASWALAAWISYVLHILADAATPHSVPLLWPVRREAFRLLPPPYCIRTGSLIEYAFAVSMAACVAIAGYVTIVAPMLATLATGAPR